MFLYFLIIFVDVGPSLLQRQRYLILLIYIGKLNSLYVSYVIAAPDFNKLPGVSSKLYPIVYARVTHARNRLHVFTYGRVLSNYLMCGCSVERFTHSVQSFLIITTNINNSITTADMYSPY